jgi:hypothetical protein
MPNPQFKVKDINEADFGRLEIELAGAFEGLCGLAALRTGTLTLAAC